MGGGPVIGRAPHAESQGGWFLLVPLHPKESVRSSGWENWPDAVALALIFVTSLFSDAGVKGVFGAAVRPEQPAVRGAET